MNNKRSNIALGLVFTCFIVGFYFLLKKNKQDIETEKKIISYSETVIDKNFPSKEQLELSNFSIYKNNNEISKETEEILTSVKHLKSFQLQEGVVKSENPEAYTINDEFQEGLKNTRELIKSNNLKNEDQVTLALIRKSLRAYHNAYFRLAYPADTSKNESFKKVFNDLASIYNQIEGKDVERYVLYVMADCADKIKDLNYYMVTPVLLTKIISDNPQDELSRKSWILLNVYMRDSFTGSSGDNTPRAWKSLISDLAVLVAGR